MTKLPTGGRLPQLNQFNEGWFTSGTLAVQRCTTCHTDQHPPEDVCHNCGGEHFDRHIMAPRGTVHSYTVVHYGASAALVEALPYTVVLVALDDDPTIRVVGNLDAAPETACIGLAVEAFWEQHDGQDERILLPQWRPISQTSDS